MLLAAQHGDSLQIDIQAPLSALQRQSLERGLQASIEGRRLTCAIGDEDDIFDVVAALRELRVAIDRIHYGAANLEELFLNQTRRTLRD